MLRSIRAKLIIIFIGLAIGPLLVLGTLLAWQTYEVEKQHAAIGVQGKSRRVAAEVEAFMDKVAGRLELIVQVRGLLGLSRDQQREILEELMAYQSDFNDMTLLDEVGHEIVRVNRIDLFSNGELADRSKEDEFVHTTQLQHTHFGAVAFSEKTGEPHMLISVPIRGPHSGKFMGVLIGDVRLKKIWQIIGELRFRPGEDVYIVDEREQVIAHRNPSLVLRGTSFALPGHRVSLAQSRQVQGLHGTEVLMADSHIRLGDYELHVVVEQATADAFALAIRMGKMVVLSTVVALLVAVILMVLMVGNIVRPVQELARVARRIGEGDISITAEVAQDDEIGELAQSFNRMTEQLRASLNDQMAEIQTRRQAEKALHWEVKVTAALSSLSSSLISILEIGEIAGLVLDKAQHITASRHGYVSTIDPVTGENVCHTLTEMMAGQCKAHGDAGKISFPPIAAGGGESLWSHALSSREPFFTNDAPHHFSAKGLPEGHVSIRQFLSVPVIIEGDLVGQIALANPVHDYDDKDLEAMVRLGRLYAIAISRYQARQEREKLLADLRQAQKMEAIGTLAGGVAHDFNNLLTPIVGYSEMALAQISKDNELHHSFVEIFKASQRAKDLVQQILTFSRQREHELVSMGLQPIVKETLKLLRSSLPTTIEIRQDISKDCGPVLSDLTQIQQVVMNLCTNAYHAMAENGGILEVGLRQVTIGSHDALGDHGLPPGNYACLSVRDTGCGMDKATLQRVFEPYFTTKEQGKGTGMGLALVHGIVKSHKGHISVYSEPGQGTQFKVYLPVHGEVHSVVDAAEGVEDDGATPRGSETILLVDDEEQVVYMMQEMLEYLGYRVIGMTDSAEALAFFRERPDGIDLVITDQTMPALTGGELAKELIALRPDLPIILCTGFSEVMTRERAEELGIREYLMKPVIVHDMARIIRKVLDQ